MSNIDTKKKSPYFVGQKIWVQPSRNHRAEREPFEATISKVGIKYFECEGLHREKFSLETGVQVSEHNYPSKTYLNYQDILDERELNRLSSLIKKAFNTYGNLPFSLEKLRQIANIINVE